MFMKSKELFRKYDSSPKFLLKLAFKTKRIHSDVTEFVLYIYLTSKWEIRFIYR